MSKDDKLKSKLIFPEKKFILSPNHSRASFAEENFDRKTEAGIINFAKKEVAVVQIFPTSCGKNNSHHL